MALFEVARGKGVRVWIAGQDMARTADIYGGDLARAMLGTVGTKIIGATTGPSAEDYSALIGKQDAKEYGITTNTSISGQGGGQAHTWNSKNPDAFTSDRFGSELGQVKVGRGANDYVTRAILFTGGRYVGLLDWPRTIWPQQRAGMELAKWLAPGFPHRTEDDYARKMHERRERELAAASGNNTTDIALPTTLREEQKAGDPRLAAAPKTDVFTLIQHQVYRDKSKDLDDEIETAKEAVELCDDAEEAIDAIEVGDLGEAIEPGLSVVMHGIELYDALTGPDTESTGVVSEIKSEEIEDEDEIKRRKRKQQRDM